MTAPLLGPLRLVTAPTVPVVTLAEAKEHCKVEVADSDAYLTALVEAATAYCEGEVEGHRQFRPATFELPLTGFPAGRLELPRPPLVSVTAVTYYDAAGALQTLGAAAYAVGTAWRQPGWIEAAVGSPWPAVQSGRTYPVAVQFVAGYPAGQCPQALKQAVLLLVCHWLENPQAVGSVGEEIAFAVTALAQSYGWGSHA